jgi:hypothetical protein
LSSTLPSWLYASWGTMGSGGRGCPCPLEAGVVAGLVRPARLVLKALKAQPVLQVQPVLRVIQDPRVPRETQAHKARRVLRVRKALRVYRDSRERLVPRATPDRLDRQAPPLAARASSR